jgi:hypothetical protein
MAKGLGEGGEGRGARGEGENMDLTSSSYHEFYLFNEGRY